MTRKRMTQGGRFYLRKERSGVVKRGLFPALIVSIFIFAALAHAEEHTHVSLPEYNLCVSFDVAASKIFGKAQIHVSAGKEVIIHPGELKITEAIADGKRIELAGKEQQKIVLQKDGTIVISYEAEFKQSEANVIDKRGIALRGAWYPTVEGMCIYRLEAVLPEGYTAVSEAEKITIHKRDNGVEFSFEFRHPLNDEDGISLIASRDFAISKDSYNGIEIFTYLFPEEASLAKTFVEHTKRYLTTYEKLFGRYPYNRFSIVEHFDKAGYSMPTYIFLGKEDFKLPIEQTPLGHEIVHQWFGNYVYTDYDKGNWNEGLAIYFADHSYEEQKGKGWQCRRRILSGYKSHVKDKIEFPLTEFTERYDLTSRSIGYGKAAMVMHMLRKEVGDKLFYASIRDFVRENGFRVASWNNIKEAFEKNAGRDLSWFFDQWIEKKGTPKLSIENISISKVHKQFNATFDLIQKQTDFRIPVPISFYSKGEKTTRIFTLDKSRAGFSITLPKKPDEIVIDDDYDLFRALTHEEDPLTLERLASDENKSIILPPERKGRYRGIVDVFNAKGEGIKLAYLKSGYPPRKDYAENGQKRRLRFSMKNGGGTKKEFFSKEITELNDEEMRSSSLVVLGMDNPAIERLFGKTEIPKDDGSPLSVDIKRNPVNPEKVVAIISISGNITERQKAAAALEQIFKYPFYTYYLLKNGQVIKKLQETPRGVRIKVGLKRGRNMGIAINHGEFVDWRLIKIFTRAPHTY